MSSALAPNVTDAAALADELARGRVVDAGKLTQALSGFFGNGPAALAEYLIGQGLLTPFQADKALAGAAGGLAVGPYLLTGVLPPGTLGPRFAAADRAGTRAFAVRVLPLRSLWQARAAKRLVKALAAGPSHPAVVPLADVDSANGVHYLVWPKVEGDLLADRVLEHGPLPPAEAARMLGQLADGLAACHRRGVAHGLLTPRSVALGSDGQARLIDLGAGPLLAQNLAGAESMFDTLSGSLSVAGGLDYAAPEVLHDPAAPGPAADQFGLGAVAYFALTGRPPYPGPSVVAALAARGGGPVPIRDLAPGVPAGLAAVVELMVGADPAGRFTSLDEALEALAAEAGEAVPPAVEESAGGGAPGAATNGYGTAGGSMGPRADAAWAAPPGAVGGRRVERDDTAESITFDLPAAAPDFPHAGKPPARPPAARGPAPVSPPLPSPPEPADTPTASVLETQPSSAGLTPAPTPRPDPRPESSPRPSPPPAPVTRSPDPLGPQQSPASTEDPTMANPLLLTSPGGSNVLPPPPARRPAPPRPPEALPPAPASPVNWVPAAQGSSGSSASGRLVRPPEPPEHVDPVADAPPPASVLWKSVKRNLKFWQAATDPVQVSVFGPPTLAAGNTARLELFLHRPEAADSVRTLSRAFALDSELIGTGFVGREVARESKVAVHVALANAGVSRSLVTFVWRGQPQRLSVDVHVPWESPAGPAQGLVSVGQDELRIGKVEFQVRVLPRTS